MCDRGRRRVMHDAAKHGRNDEITEGNEAEETGKEKKRKKKAEEYQKEIQNDEAKWEGNVT